MSIRFNPNEDPVKKYLKPTPEKPTIEELIKDLPNIKELEAAKQAISSALLESSIDGAKGVLINVTGGPKLGLVEINEASTLMNKACHEEANIIFGTTIKEDFKEDEVQITVVATGFPEEEVEKKIMSNGTTQEVAKKVEPSIVENKEEVVKPQVATRVEETVVEETPAMDSEIPTLFKRRR